ncbi:aldo/keto reductase [Aureimonas jatrophae]|uniref:Predicted oxidoreductase n=1 Tax=Aureimonas jatrophae TaxID=1166073 RepID=A0A1H0HM80_9HYPH|nr:aldo/keto reductase [Aureimonas jatrophae]MBB3950664.1 aryl-alcohol dehydrogenase-like predicted oxidoreductase [Aureimonas jatrophae]SDO20207.1 Predicted oxidoreductase [Aureimonas jatrophae]
MQSRALGRTGLSIMPLVFGGNVFGWTADEATSFRLLDAFVDHGFNAIDTADVYSAWAPGNQGGESETIIGRWLKRDPAKRDRVVIITKVGSDVGEGKTLRGDYIPRAAEKSLARLGIDRIDLYLSHWPDDATPHEETLGAFARLKDEGKIAAIGCSNFSADQLKASLAAAERNGLPRYDVLQPEYNLVARSSLEGPLLDLCRTQEIGVITYYSLASGFLSGKYRSQDDLSKSQRGGGLAKYLDARGLRVLDALDEVAGRHKARPAEVALAWIMHKPGVTAPIASATSVDQLESLARSARISLTEDDMRRLDEASA